MIDQFCFSFKKNMCAPELKEVKNITHSLLLKASTSPLMLSVYKEKNFAEEI